MIPSYINTLLLFFMLSCILSEISSHWIQHLYTGQPDTLSYPRNIHERAFFRKPFLSISFTLLGLSCLTFSVPVLIYHLLLIYFLLLTICTDFEQHVIYDRMLLPFGLLAFPMVFLLELPLMNHLIAAFAGGGIFLFLAILTRGGIGGGDIKLIFVLGLWMGTGLLTGTVILGFCLGGIAAIFFLLIGRKKRKEYLAYGPYFAAAAIFLSLR